MNVPNTTPEWVTSTCAGSSGVRRLLTRARCCWSMPRVFMPAAGTRQWPSLNAPREANLRSVSVANATRVWDIQNLVDLNDSPQIAWRQGRLFYTVSASSPLEWTYQDIAHQPITGDLYNELLSRTQQYQQRFPLATVVPTETHRYVVFVVYVQDTLLGNPGSPNTEYPLEIMELNPMWRQQPGP